MRIVLDSNILVRAFVNSCGLPQELLSYIFASSHTLILSNEMLSEMARVLRYPRLIASHGRSEEEIYNFTSWLRERAEIVSLNPFTITPIRDEKDIFVLQTALSGEAQVICTWDRDFFEPPASTLLENRGIEALTDIELMRRLRI